MREGKEEAEGQQMMEAKEDARRLRNDFKHYIRSMWLFKNGQDVNESYDAGSIDAERDRLGSFFPVAVSHAFRSRPASAILKSQHKNRSIITGGGVSSPMSTSGGALWS